MKQTNLFVICMIIVLLVLIIGSSGCTTIKRAFGGIDPEAVIVTTTNETPADVPEKFTRPCGNEGLLPRGSSVEEMIDHAGDQSEHLYGCSDKTDELRTWNEKDKENNE